VVDLGLSLPGHAGTSVLNALVAAESVPLIKAHGQMLKAIDLVRLRDILQEHRRLKT